MSARERPRIARELHDSIAHSVSVMVLQAGAAEQVVMDASERAGVALAAIQDVGRDAVVELRRLLMLLRSADDSAFGSAAGDRGGSTRCSRMCATPAYRSS